MNTKYLYLTLDLLAFVVPLIFSFYPKTNFSKKWRYVIPAILFSSVIFIIWDAIFTSLGVWGFNAKYISGIYVFNLPIEEILFFICIPYACLFTYFALTHFIAKDHLFPHHEIITSFLIIITLIMGIYHLDKLYTGITFLFTGFFLAFHMIKVRPRYMGRFYLSFAVLLFPFLIMNGALTGGFTNEPVVWYNNSENLALRIWTIPVEDVFYGMLMILIPITIAEQLEILYPIKKKSPEKSRLVGIVK